MEPVALGPSPFANVERKPSDQTLSSGHGSSTSLSSSMSRQSSVESFGYGQQPGNPSRRDAKAINARLMGAHSLQEIFGIVVEHLPELDSINVTAALQRLAKFLASDDYQLCSMGSGGSGGSGNGRSRGLKEAVLGSPVFQALAAMMVEQCNGGLFNAQSTANAWWAVAKLHAPEHPASVEMVGALENALIACLTAPADSAKPNAQGVSSVWYSCGRLASDGYAPSPVAMSLLWDRTHKLSLSFDSQGIANMLWAFGQLRKKHGEAFPVRTDVLASLHFVVARIAPSFAVQGLSCAAVGCSNMGPALRPAVLPLVHVLVAESLRRVWQFNLQAMSNMASAISRMGRDLVEGEDTRTLLAAFDAHAATLPPGQKTQEAAALCSALKSCGVGPVRFRPPGGAAAGAQHAQQAATAFPLPPPPAPHHTQMQGGLRDATNGAGWAGTGPAGSASGSISSSASWGVPSAAGVHCLPAHQLAALAALAGVSPPQGVHQQQQNGQHHNQPQQQQYHQHQAWHALHQQLQYQSRPPLAPPAQPVLTLPLAGSGPLSISQYAALAQQLAAASQGRAAPALQQQPSRPLIFAAMPVPASEAHWQASQGGFAQPAPPAPTTGSDLAHLQRILAVLQSVKAQSAAAAAAAAVSAPMAG